jgi:hypothetical protein
MPLVGAAAKTTASIELSFVMRLSRDDVGKVEYRNAAQSVNANASSDAIMHVVPIPDAWSTIADQGR